MKRTRHFLTVILAGIMAVSLAACGTQTAAVMQEGEQTEKKKYEKIEGTMKVIATSESYKPLFDKFTKEVGPKVEAVSLSTGEVLDKLKKEGGTPDADLWFGGGIESFMDAKEHGLLEPVHFDAAEELTSTYKDSGNYWFSKGLTVVGFIVNEDLLRERGLEIPESWDDLTEEEYKDEIIMANPATSGTNYAVVNAILQMKGGSGWDYFKRLNENIAYYSKRSAAASERVAVGEVAIGITYIDGTLDKLRETANVSIVYPSDGMPYAPEGVAVFANAENGKAAKAFVEWLYSDDENMKLLAEIDQKNTCLLVKPDIKGLKLDFDQSQLMREDLSRFGKEREEILAAWDILAGDKAE